MKKIRLILSMVCLLAFGMIVNQAQAQQTKGGTPPTFLVKEAQALPAQAYVKMPVNFSVEELLEQDAFNKKNGIGIPHIARIIPADITMKNSGVWTELPDGRRVWRTVIEAKGAKALLIRYSDFYLPAGSQLFIYNEDRTHITGAFDNLSNSYGKEYVTPLVAGDISILEYVEPAIKTGDEARISVSGIGYGYNHLYIIPKSLGQPIDYLHPDDALECQVDVICSPEGDEWQVQKTGVVQMVLDVTESYGSGYYGLCTGTLINNTANDGKPYVISAQHCTDGMTVGDLNASYFIFFYESKECGDNIDHFIGMEHLVGAVEHVTIPINGSSDGILLELNQPIPTEWIADCKVQFAGWDRREIAPASGVGISHPRGAPKKIATINEDHAIVKTTAPLNWGGGVTTPAGRHWEVYFKRTENGLGQTEEGSSGSGLLNQHGLLVGTLSGGASASCTGNETSYTLYGGLFYHWDQYGTEPSTQMKTWLDPVGNGTAETCPPWPACNVVDFAAFPTNIFALQSSKFTGIAISTADSVFWEFEGGTPAISTERKPVITYYAAGVFDAKLTAHFTNSQGQDSVVVVDKDDYITVTIKGGADADVPVAGLAVLDITDISPAYYTDNGNTTAGYIGSTTPSVLRNGASGSDAATYWKEATSESAGVITDAELDNTASTSIAYWVRRNNAVTSNRPVANGYSGSGDYYYAFYRSTATEYQARMFNREPFDFSVPVRKARLNFKLLRNTYVASFLSIILGTSTNGFSVQYRKSPADRWKTLLYLPKETTLLENTTIPQGWQDYTIELPELTSTYQIGFVGQANTGYGLALDNIEIITQDGETKPHVTIWEGDVVDYYDLSAGYPVFYKYDFEGGSPAISTSTASPIPVQYNTEGLYDAGQWVKNTFGEDSITLEDYVTVLARVLESDPDEINACGDILTQDITITSNRSWSVTNMPAWVTATPNTHTHTSAEGTDETTTVTITVSPNTGYQARLGAVVFTSDDGKIRKAVSINQSTMAIPGLTAVAVPENNAQITWNRLPGMPLPPTVCDIIKTGKGDFETDPSGIWTTVTDGEGPGWEWLENEPLDDPRYCNFAHTGTYSMVSFSYHYYDGNPYNTDNWLITPKLKVSDDYHTLTYWIAQFDMLYSQYFDKYDLKISTTTNDISAFTVTLKADEVPPLGPVSENYYIKYNVDLSAYTGQEIYIAFRHHEDNMWGLLLDDVTGLELADCTSSTTGIAPGKINMLSLKNGNGIRNTDNADIDKLRTYNAYGKIAVIADKLSKQQSVLTDKESVINNNLVRLQSATLQNNLAPQAINVADLTELTWSNWEPASLVDAAGNAIRAAHKWTAAEASAYKDYAIKAIEVGIGDAADISIFIIEGNTTIYSQHVGRLETEYGELLDTVIELDYPVIISGNADLYIGYSLQSGHTGYPLVRDEGPAVDGKGNLYSMNNGAWQTVATGNWVISGWAEKPKPSGFSVYRQRYVNGVTTEDPEIIAESLTDTTYFDGDIRPGGEYCYWVTYTNINLESCPSDTGCVFIMYYQEIDRTALIEKTYGDIPFKIDRDETDGYLIKSTADDFDYFAGRAIPVKLDPYDGDLSAITLTGTESDYSVSINHVGSLRLAASQQGIPDTLFAADSVLITIIINKKELKVIADDTTRQQGKPNPDFTFSYDAFAEGEDESYLDVQPTAACAAGILSPLGEYPILVYVDNDKNYNLIPVNGVLHVIRSEEKVNVFTPYDIDNLNDYFMPGYNLKIFNRYGVLIYETENVSQKLLGWDGTFKNSSKLVNPGVYYYVAYDETTGKVIRKGSVNVVKK
jgi:hypothetical protein